MIIDWEIQDLTHEEQQQQRSNSQAILRKNVSDNDSLDLSFSIASVIPLNKRDTSSIASVSPSKFITSDQNSPNDRFQPDEQPNSSDTVTIQLDDR